jgi:hypothetical protein
VFTPNAIGAAIEVAEPGDWNWRMMSGILEHRVTFNFEQLPFSFFLLDDATFGRLDDDAGVLGF